MDLGKVTVFSGSPQQQSRTWGSWSLQILSDHMVLNALCSSFLTITLPGAALLALKWQWDEPYNERRSNSGVRPTRESRVYHLTRTSQARPRRVRLQSHEARLYHILPATRPSQQPPLVPRLAALGIGGAWKGFPRPRVSDAWSWTMGRENMTDFSGSRGDIIIYKHLEIYVR